MLTKLKEKMQTILFREATIAHKLGLTPNSISVIGVALAFLSAFFYINWRINDVYLLYATFLILASGFCDILDGVLARQYNQATAFGGFFDSLLDRYADAAIYIGLIWGGLCDVPIGAIALTGSLIVSYSRARAEAAGIKMESIGLAERAERIVILAIASTASFFYQSREAVNVGIILLATLTNFTVLQRSCHTYRKLTKHKQQAN
jgi:archaetidylinositol phosphate synthase